MRRILLELPPDVRSAMWTHLLPNGLSSPEEVAFVYAHPEGQDGTTVFRCREWFPVPPGGFVSRSGFHLELTDETKASVIKRAHDLGASLVEFHSHGGIWPAKFSESDYVGFREFVPHVWWRLKGRPYLAIVVSRSGFDGLAWVSNPNKPVHLDGIVVEESILAPTKLSPL